MGYSPPGSKPPSPGANSVVRNWTARNLSERGSSWRASAALRPCIGTMNRWPSRAGRRAPINRGLPALFHRARLRPRPRARPKAGASSASEARHRFGFGPHVIVRKRHRRCALAAHSKACGATAYTSALARKIDERVYALYGHSLVAVSAVSSALVPVRRYYAREKIQVSAVSWHSQY
jgi:hypothetical protein